MGYINLSFIMIAHDIVHMQKNEVGLTVVRVKKQTKLKLSRIVIIQCHNFFVTVLTRQHPSVNNNTIIGMQGYCVDVFTWHVDSS